MWTSTIDGFACKILFNERDDVLINTGVKSTRVFYYFGYEVQRNSSIV